MTNQELINEILTAIDSQETAQPETKLIDFAEWNSLASMVTIGIIQDNFNKSITSEQLRKCETFKDIYNLCL